MKKIYILLCITFLFHENKAQHTLTAAFNPAIGDIESYIEIDTSGLSLGSSGVSQTWNYTGISTGTNTPFTFTYVPMASVINNTLYPTGTVARRIGIGGYDYIYSNSSSKVEYLGFAQPTASNCQVYNDPATFYSLPFSYGSSSSDTYSYTSWTGSYNGTIISTGDGTGTLQLPSGNYPNILKLTIFFNQPGSFISVENRFFSALSKFPLLTISSSTVGTSVFKGGQINTLVSTSLKASKYHNTPSLFPNPVTNGELFLRSEGNEPVEEIEIINVLGQEVLRTQPHEINGTDNEKIDVSTLEKGIYYLRIITDVTIKSQKIIIE